MRKFIINTTKQQHTTTKNNNKSMEVKNAKKMEGQEWKMEDRMKKAAESEGFCDTCF